MTVRLSIDGDVWRRHVDRFASSCPGIIPVVKGNGYGFGREQLAAVAAELSDLIAVGTIHELAGLPHGVDVLVLAPAVHPGGGVHRGAQGPILTVGSVEHVRLLDGWRGRVTIKLASAMRRFGVRREHLGELVAAAADHHLDVVSFSLHPPVAGSDDEHVAEVARWLDVLEEDDELWVSHLAPSSFRQLTERWPDRRFRLRSGTGLWHGDKSAFHLQADVLHRERVEAGDVAGYHQTLVPTDGHLLVVGAGSAHGIHRLPGGLSPFHHARRRLTLLENPHMHSSMVVLPAEVPAPAVGAWVDVQWPLINVHADVIRWTT